MPDAHGNFKSISVPADAWERIFGPKKSDDLLTTDAVKARYDELLRRNGLPPIYGGDPNRDKRPTDK